MKTKHMTTLRSFSSRSPSRLALLLIPLVFACFALSQSVQGVVPPPDGGYPGFTTAEGTNALKNLTTGAGNTGVGWFSLFTASTANFNTGVGAGTLTLNTGDNNTAMGAVALFLNTTGINNTAVGAAALVNNTVAHENTAIGAFALNSNTEGDFNTATGAFALVNTIGQRNTAMGDFAMFSNTTGSSNTATGNAALDNNTTGSNNIGIGRDAGTFLTTGDNNIDIGNSGLAEESNKIRIGEPGFHDGTFIAGIDGIPVTGAAVLVDGFGQLGTMASSQRFKDEIKAMDNASEAILALKPVTFRYKKQLDPAAMPQFGLVAEEVEKVNPDLVVRDKEGKPYTVRYEAVNAMLLNEFLKEHRTVQELKSTVAKQEATILQQKKDFQATAAHQQKQIDALTAGLQKVSAQLAAASPSDGRLEASKSAPQVANNP
jgi:hypothetical protein